jgi:two-component sensor histidine kinase/AmiR/NasT family two-component response regulator
MTMMKKELTTSPANGKRILLVDDDLDLCAYIGLHLSRLNYNLVATAGSAEEAVTLAAQLQPDLIIMDVQLNGEMDGVMAANIIRQSSNVPVVFLTSLSSEELLHRIKTANAVAYILKPINERELRVVIEMALYKHEVEVRLKRNEIFNRAILNSVSAEIAVIDADGVIVAVNRAWRDFANGGLAPHCANELTDEQYGIGMNYLNVCSPKEGSDNAAEVDVRQGILSVLNRTLPCFDLEYPCHSAHQKRWFHMSVTPFENGEGGAVVSHMDITARKQVEEDLRLAVHDKNVLIKEVHHRVKNNLQVVTSLLRLESTRDLQTDAKLILHTMQSRIQTLALLHEFLYRHSQFSSVDLNSYLRELGVLSFRSMNHDLGNVSLVFDLAGSPVNIDQATCCGLFVNELISNSLKHAFPDTRKGQISVRLQPTGVVGQMLLSVSDNGVGLPNDFAEKRQKSLGLELVASLAQQIGGELKMEQGLGLLFSVRFAVNLGSRDMMAA